MVEGRTRHVCLWAARPGPGGDAGYRPDPAGYVAYLQEIRELMEQAEAGKGKGRETGFFFLAFWGGADPRVRLGVDTPLGAPQQLIIVL